MMPGIIIRFKVYMDRARIYVGYIQFAFTMFIMLKVYDDTSIGEWLFTRWWAIALFFVLFFVGLIIIGYLDKRYIRPHEQSEMNSTNPEIMEILKLLRDERNKV